MATHEAQSPHQGAEDTRPIAVLLVDDQLIVGAAVGQLLASEPGITLHCCDRAVDAIARANALAPAIILQDLLLPDIDGLTLVGLFRTNPPTATTPIVVLSGNDDAKTRERARAAGANDYLVKLPTRDELVACIRRHTAPAGRATNEAATAGATPAHAPAHRDAEATLDRSVIAGYRQANVMGLPDFAIGLIEQFTQESAAQVEQLRAAGGRQDRPALKATAHSLKGSSMTMGANRLAALCAQVESHATGPAGGTVSADLLVEIDRELVKVREALAAERQGVGQS